MELPKAYSRFAQVSLAFEAAKAGLHKSTSTGLSFVICTHLAYLLPTFKSHKRVILNDVIRHGVDSHRLLYSRWSPDRSARIEVVHETVDQLQLEGFQGELPLFFAGSGWLARFHRMNELITSMLKIPQNKYFHHLRPDLPTL